jgi:hypothetical protein
LHKGNETHKSRANFHGLLDSSGACSYACHARARIASVRISQIERAGGELLLRCLPQVFRVRFYFRFAMM